MIEYSLKKLSAVSYQDHLLQGNILICFFNPFPIPRSKFNIHDNTDTKVNHNPMITSLPKNFMYKGIVNNDIRSEKPLTIKAPPIFKTKFLLSLSNNLLISLHQLIYLL